MADSDHYCTAQEAADHAQIKLALIQSWSLGVVDDLIERYMGYGYKGATRTTLKQGTNNRLLKLPGPAATITSVTDDINGVLPASDYVLEPRGRVLRRVSNGVSGYLYPSGSTCWVRDRLYTIEYVEPSISELPGEWHMAAIACVAHIAMFSDKYHGFGVALSASDAGQAGKVATSGSTSFPASLEEELMRKLKTLLRRALI